MKKAILLLAALFLIPLNLSAQVQLMEQVLKAQKVVRFTNYNGEVTKPDRVEDIIGIGRILADSRSNESASVKDKYYVRRIAVSNRDLYSADIVGIAKDARVNHIKNVRRILAGYLADSFRRPLKEALTIATFVTYYNSAIRQDPKLLAAYAPAVVAAVDPAKAGIALNYRDWPGRTEMLIPIEISPFFGSNISSSELYDQATKQMQQQADMGVPERQEMLASRQSELEQKRQQLDQAVEANQRRSENLEAAVTKIQGEEPSTARDEKLQDANAARSNIAQQAANLQSEQDRLAEQNKKLAQQQADLAKDIKKVNYSGVETEKYLYFMRYLRKEKEVIIKQLTAVIKETLTIGRIKPGVTGMNTPIFGEDIFSVYPNSSTAKFSLTLFDGETFDIIRQSSQAVYPNTYLDLDVNLVYAVVEVGGKYYLGQFAADTLNLVRRTDKQVFPNTGIVVSSEMIFLLLSDGKENKIGAFKKEDLSFIKFVE
jgi:hypothetical protein